MSAGHPNDVPEDGGRGCRVESRIDTSRGSGGMSRRVGAVGRGFLGPGDASPED